MLLGEKNISSSELNVVWRKQNENVDKNTTIEIEEDGNYFLFLKVTLQSKKQGVKYTVTVKKKPHGNHATRITDGHINETNNSTGFIGIRVLLTQNTSVTVICSPTAEVDQQNTYLGLIKF